MNLFPRLSQFADFDNLFENFNVPMRSGSCDFFSPRVDVKESDDSFEITAEIPGVKREDVNLDIHDGMMTLSAELKQEDKEEKDGKIIRQERRYGKYQRSFHVGENVSEQDISARFEDGVLAIVLPKVKSEKREKQRIAIS